MRTALIVLLATAGPLAAHEPLYLDLSGEWRTNPGDQPAFADPGFDDRGWETVRLPWQNSRPRQVFWLRRTVDLPLDIDRSRLALTLGPVSEVYEVYVNGVQIGATGPFFDNTKAQLARTRTFPVPAEAAGAGSRMQIAIRGRGVYFGSSRSPVIGGGSYLLSDPARAPVSEALAMIEAQKLRYVPQGVFPILLAGLSLLAFLFWLSDRSSPGLLWLVLVLLSRAGNESIAYSQISLSSFPRAGIAWGAWLTAVNVAALAELALATFRLRPGWVRLVFWCSAFGSVAFATLSYGALVAYVVAFLCLAKNWRNRPPAARAWVEPAALVSLGVLSLIQWLGTINMVESLPGISTQVQLGAYTASSQSLAILVLGAILTLLSLQLLIADRAEKQRLAGELEAARVVQQLLLESPHATRGAWAAEAVYLPAQEVGGDFYLIEDRSDGSRVVVVGDVSGKGLKAAMLVSVAIGMLRMQKSASPAAILAELNDGLAGHTGGGFVTCCCARFDPDGRVTIANAGHPAPYADGAESEVEAGLPLGVMRGVWYQESAVAGTQFTFVSDGVVEAENSRRELFGFDRTREISTKPAREIAEAAKAWGQNDDITVVTVRRRLT